ncbi:sulfurtransferase complex subunit TusD [Methylomonas sp. MgM2]
MKFAIQVNTSPYASDAGVTAYRFIQAALQTNHQILQVFFYREGISHGLRYALPPDDETNLTSSWTALANDHAVDLLICISAAQRRGLLCLDEAKRQGAHDDNLADGFRIGGLGQWLEATLKADRVIVFG